ncbi:stalk domain-containing protein [Paenibacillus sp. FA6]|uniref:stalk domain-containing protein n=1 Tax=Paenibacillus sp. FA6 TaxID=3413029 RepID=UPI003F65BE63
MLKHKALTRITLAIILLTTIFSGVAYAASSTKIDVNFYNLKYFFNGIEKKAPEDNKGFIYKGTTYVPLRFVADNLNQVVKWKSDTYTISMTSKQLGAETGGNVTDAERLKEAEQKIAELEKRLNDQGSSSSHDGWVTYETKNLKLHFTPKADEKFHYLYTEAENILKAHEKFFGANTLTKKVEIWIHDGDGIFKIDTGAFYNEQHNAIKLAAEESYNMAGDDAVRFVFAHELAHAYLHQKWDIHKLGSTLSGRLNWLLEGQADYLAKKVLGYSQYGSRSDPAGDKRDLAFYKNELKTRNSASGWAPINWSNIKSFADLNAYPNEYFAFESMVFFLQQNYSHDQYLNLYNEIAKGSLPSTAFKNAFGKSEETLVSEYKKYLSVE